MRLTNSCQNERGAALIISLMFLAILGLLGITAVVMTTTDMQIGGNYRANAQAFSDADAGVNYAIAMMEAGLKASPQTFSLPTTVGGTSALTYTVPSGFSFSISDITMLGANTYSFTSTGSGPGNAQALVAATFSVSSPFNYGIFGVIGMAMSGNGRTDSYNSSVGPYTWATHSTNGDVGTNATGAGAISLSGNAKVYGDAQVGVGGDPSTAITTSGNAAVVPPGQKLAADEAKDMTPLALPSGGIPRSAWSLSANDSETIYSGTYRLPGISITGNGVGEISGDVTLYVTGHITISGNGRLSVLAGGSLTIYVSGNVIISGNGITNNTSYPEDLQIYGTSTCASITIHGNADLYGAIYAPAASVAISGNGDIYGSVIGRSVAISGNGNVHYDEALQTAGPSTDLQLISWREEM
ncbi:MAG: pilus assembly PilX N-terminal domain-containing protein [Deltaproteobacteria bacterium]|nr:pilus assembly PilX N-terminal domain-containing protein [Deltaproteobacteria bacterium]MBW2048004.1 pilus assembly PilX N-terminal domain-containing protein [Deltaproteobacteria bacterium]MBW2111381.1 pilus assembly PilX N-terminal domain-containing protein [Deltaproteobacteria bacterium]MBW2353960.1 pilus assembly PilX N-terminal domain-containing protein [Deltaproteobacteria bacterium]HDZ90622.1 hypothetical protein [Deltaproteobacteria bacterium]